MSTATTHAADQAASPWHHQILEQLTERPPADDETHVAIFVPADGTEGDPEVLGLYTTAAEATVAAADYATYAQYLDGDVFVTTVEDLNDANGSATRVAGTSRGEDPDKGQLFNIAIDETQPNLVILAFSGEIKLDRNEAQWVDLFNRLQEGKVGTLKVGVFTSASKKVHRRDNDGNVDAVVQTKSIKITDLHLEQP